MANELAAVVPKHLFDMNNLISKGNVTAPCNRIRVEHACWLPDGADRLPFAPSLTLLMCQKWYLI